MEQMNENRELTVKLTGVKKRYKLGAVGGATLQEDLQSWWAKMRGMPDPNLPIGQDERLVGKSFMALNGIDLTIYKGEAVGIIGGNGAGKSTMLKILSRVTAPTEGKVQIWGRIASMLEVGTGFHGELTGRENIYMNGAILGMTKAEIDAKIDDIIEFSEVRDFIDTPVKRYSSGMYVKLAFSVAAHLDSEIMIMDEVLAVGDMAFQRKCLNKMRQAAKQEDRTVLYVSHNMDTIRRLCDRCVVLSAGTVVYDGDVEKAISLYEGQHKIRVSTNFSFYNIPRPFVDFGKKVFIESFRFINKKVPKYEKNEKIVFEINYHAFQDIGGIKFYFVLKNENGNNIGMAQTFEAVSTVKVGQSYSALLSWNASNIAPGKYHFQIDLFINDTLGRHLTLDHPDLDIPIEIYNISKAGINWQSYFGNVSLLPLVVQSVKERKDESNKN